jgi:hypothetical protein
VVFIASCIEESIGGEIQWFTIEEWIPLACTYLSSKVVFIFLMGIPSRFTSAKTMSSIGHGLMRIKRYII